MISVILASKILNAPLLISSWDKVQLPACLDASIREAQALFLKLKELQLPDENGFLGVHQVLPHVVDLGLASEPTFSAFGYMQRRSKTIKGAYNTSLEQEFAKIMTKLSELSVYVFICSSYTFPLVFSRDGCFYADSHPKTKRGVFSASNAVWVRFDKAEAMALHFVSLFTPYSVWELEKLVQMKA